MQNWSETIQSQYANSPTLSGLIQYMNDWIDPKTNINEFLANIWDVTTAVGLGLDIWGQIVNVPRVLKIAQTPTYFGFNEAYTVPTQLTGVQPFNQAPMYNGPLATTSYELSDSAYRTLILVKALTNITSCSTPSINSLLQFLFAGDGRCYVQDTGGMTERFVFEFNLSPVQLAIMHASNVIPRAAGVQAYIMNYAAGATFSFNEADGLPFGVGTFFTANQLVIA